MANLTILVQGALDVSSSGSHVPDEMNITKISCLAPARLDKLMYSPSSILIMLLLFIALLLTLVLFCLCTNPVPRQVEIEQGSSLFMTRPQRKEEKDLKIDYAHLKLADQLENLHAIQLEALEQDTLKSRQSEKAPVKMALESNQHLAEPKSSSNKVRSSPRKTIESALSPKNDNGGLSVQSVASLGKSTTNVTAPRESRN